MSKRDRRQYFVYVIELDDDVGDRIDPSKPCVYVGSSWHEPDERFRQHLAGYRSSRYVRKHGVRLRPRLFHHLNPFPDRASAEAMEVELGRRLKQRGYRVFGAH